MTNDLMTFLMTINDLFTLGIEIPELLVKFAHLI